MRTFVLAFALVVVGVATSPSLVRAEWLLNGTPVCTMGGAQSNARLAPDGSGGAVILWTDERRGAGLVDLYATRILGDGSIAPGWPAGGVPVTTEGNGSTANSHWIVGDGAGGLLAFWMTTDTKQARMQHVDGSGALAPGFPANGMVLPLTTGGPSGWWLSAVTDGAGGAFVAWNHWNSVADELDLTRVDGTGAFAPGWNASGVVQNTTDPFSSSGGFTGLGLVPDPSGGALTSSNVHYRFSPGDVADAARFTRTNTSGTKFTSGPNFPPSSVPPLSVVADGAGGVFESWFANSARQVQYILPNGSAAWPASTTSPVSDVLIRDGGGGIFLFGHSDADQLELHRRAADASFPSPWTSSGVVVSSAGPFTAWNAVRSGGLEYAAWSSGPAGANDVRAAALTPDGALAPGWAPGGTVVCNAPNSQVLTSMIDLPPNDALIAWADARSGDPDVYVAKLAAAGPPPLSVPPTGPANRIALALSPNPAGRSLHVSFTLPGASSAWVELVDLAGRVLERVQAEPRIGTQSLALETSRLPGGLYWARVRQAERITASRFAIVH